MSISEIEELQILDSIPQNIISTNMWLEIGHILFDISSSSGERDEGLRVWKKFTLINVPHLSEICESYFEMWIADGEEYCRSFEYLLDYVSDTPCASDCEKLNMITNLYAKGTAGDFNKFDPSIMQNIIDHIN